MKKLFIAVGLLFLVFLLELPLVSFSQNIGIGTNIPLAKLHVADSSVVFTASGDIPIPQGNPPVEIAGRRLMWYSDKAAFRVGYTSDINGNLWTKDNIGNYSFATGSSCNASGLAAFAAGGSTTASGLWSFAIGNGSLASGPASCSMGTANYATGESSMAIGYFTRATSNFSLAMGKETHAYGLSSTSLGTSTTASGTNSTAMGTNTVASGSYSTAMGNHVSTSNFEGAFAIGDNSSGGVVMGSFVANGFRSRFAGGYRLLTNSAATIGVVLGASGNAWSAISDVNMKENFLPVNGEYVLKSIAALPQFTWNYKGQDAKTLRHYGPMAQDFYKAFGKDDLGEIGCDTLINQQDFLGVNLIAIQALEKRTTDLSNRLDKALALINLQAKEIDLLKEQNKNLSINNK